MKCVMRYVCRIESILFRGVYTTFVAKLNNFHDTIRACAYYSLFYITFLHLNRNCLRFTFLILQARNEIVVSNYCDDVWINLPVNYNRVKRSTKVRRFDLPRVIDVFLRQFQPTSQNLHRTCRTLFVRGQQPRIIPWSTCYLLFWRRGRRLSFIYFITFVLVAS